MPRKMFHKLMVVDHNFTTRSQRSCCLESPESPLSPRTPSSCSSDGDRERDNTLRWRARQRVRKLAMGAAAALNGVCKDVPRGCMAVYVGKEKKRFIISTHYLSHRLFRALLKRSEEEFGFSYKGGLLIACEAVLFEHLLWLIGTNDPSARTTELEELLDFYEF